MKRTLRNIKSAFLAVALFAASGTMLAQSKHMTFMGIPMNKKASEFCKLLTQKEFKETSTHTSAPNLHMRGKVWNIGVLADIIGNAKNKKVNSVTLMTTASIYAEGKKDKAALNDIAPRVMSYILQSVLDEYHCVDVSGNPFDKSKGESWSDEQTGDWHMPTVYVSNGKSKRPIGIIDLYMRETADDICIYADLVDIKNSGIEELHRIEEE